jgi:hypothetical protein
MPRHFSALAFAWVATLAGAFIAGRVAGPLLVDSQPAPVAEVRDVRSSQASAPSVRSSQPAEKPTRIAESATEPAERAQASKVSVPLDVILREALQEPDAVEKVIGLAEVLRNVDATTIASLVAEFDAENDGEDWSVMQHRQLFFYKWGTLDGDAALAYLETSGGNKHHKRYLMGSVLSGWASQDADEAIAWAEANHAGDGENPHMIGIVSGLAKTDLTRAGDLLQEMPFGSSRGRAAHDVVRAHMREGETEAKQWAADLPGNELKDGVVSMIARELAKESPQQAAQWIDTLDDVNPKKSVSSIARQWAREEPEQAANWVASFEDEGTRQSSLPSVISQWASKDLHAAGEWLRDYPATPDRDAAIASYVYRIAREDADSAEAWAEAIVDDKQRERVARSIKQMSKHRQRVQVRSE